MKNIFTPTVLIISNIYDFSTDFICQELSNKNINYLRINRDSLKDYEIFFDPLLPKITGTYNNLNFSITNETLKSIYFRAPSFLRDIYQDTKDEEEQLIRTQWTAFLRYLIVFENVKWLNNPSDIYKAEIKSYQLYIANKIGFNVPKTIISNKITKPLHEKIAIKSIDTAIISLGEDEGFVYTEIYDRNELSEEVFSSPFFIQEGLLPKVDLRVTVIEDEVIAIKIVNNQNDGGIDIDWRRLKNELHYEIYELPEAVKKLCRQLLKELNLNFGGIDLVLHKNAYFFIEINPTGEWSWLQQTTGVKLDSIIANSLI